MTTPLESIESTVTRLRAKVGPDGYHADEIARAQVELDDAVLARDMDAKSLAEWEEILDTLRADKRDLEQFKVEFLRRHPAAEEARLIDGLRDIYNQKVRDGGGSMKYTVEKTAGGFGVLKSDNPITKGDYIVNDDSDKLTEEKS